MFDLEEAFEEFVFDRFPFASLEEMLMSPLGFGITTATPVQIAICRILSGKSIGDLLGNEDVIEALGGHSEEFDVRPSEVVVCAAIRSAKSLIAAALGIWASQTVDLSPATASGDHARFSIASIEKDNANIIIKHLKGALEKPAFSSIYISHDDYREESAIKESGGESLIGSFFLRHPSGVPVEIRIVAGKRAGGSLVSRWSAGCVLDEAPRMVGGQEGVVNYDDMRNAVLGRLLPGAVLFSIGSPWARSGPIYDAVMSEWGHPAPGRVILKARGPQMNPIWWTPERCEALRVKDPDAYQTDVLAEFLDVAEALFPDVLLQRVTRDGPEILPWTPGNNYVAFMDAGVARNSWTFVITTKEAVAVDDGSWRWIKKVVFATEWVGTKSKRNDPGAILSEVSAHLEAYRIDSCYADQWGWDGFHALAQERGFNLVLDDSTPREKTQAYLDLARDMHEGNIELSPNKAMRRDLVLVKKLRRGGQTDVAILLPETADGRHCDFAPPVVGSVMRFISDPELAAPPEGTRERVSWDAMMRQEAAAEKLENEEEEMEWLFDD